MRHFIVLTLSLFTAEYHCYRPSRNVFFPCSFKGQVNYQKQKQNLLYSYFHSQLDSLCQCGLTMSRCSKTGYQDSDQYTGCIRSDHVRYCCEDDIHRHQWLYSLSSFISDEDSDSSSSTCIKYISQLSLMLLIFFCYFRQGERWLGGKTRMSHIGEVVCSDPTYVHCRVKQELI